MKLLVSLVVVVGLFIIGMGGAASGLQVLFGIVIPYAAAAIFIIGIILRVLGWAKVPVPFRIPTTCGQQKSLEWIKQSKFDNPDTLAGVVGRMILEVICFRSLLRNSKAEMVEGKGPIYMPSLFLWAGAMAFHWSMVVIIIRHLRFFTEPVPFFISWLQIGDGFLQVGLPAIYITSVVFIASLAYLLLRRIASPQVRYITLINDYFPLILLIGIGVSGFWLRHLHKTDVVGVKELVLGLITFSPAIPQTVNSLFFGHFFLVSLLLAYFPFSKLLHMAGVFLSPTRNLANNTREVRHINPWDYPVKTHSYEEYEDEFRDKMKAAGLSVDKE